MTKITQKKQKNDMHLHIDKAYSFIQDNLPIGYVEKTLKKLNDSTVTPGMVRNMKCRVSKYPTKRIEILDALVEVVKDYKRKNENFKKNIEKI